MCFRQFVFAEEVGGLCYISDGVFFFIYIYIFWYIYYVYASFDVYVCFSVFLVEDD